jgi:hypothetical protein
MVSRRAGLDLSEPHATVKPMDAYCPGCREELPFEMPVCDEHGLDCPELACVLCGWALVGPFEVAVVSASAGSAGAAA